MANMVKDFTSPTSVVRKIWGKADVILLIFAGAAAEFALNKAVDWLYFTGRLPADPFGRLFSTVTYARDIIFSSEEEAFAAIDKMRGIHTAVESSRGFNIPDEAYRDVLFMLIYYSISAFELIERKLLPEEKEEVVSVFLRVGNRMQIKGLPTSYHSWCAMYDEHTMNHLRRSPFTADLFRQYKRQLGTIRFFLLVESQKLLVSPRVRNLLGLSGPALIRPLIRFYRFSRILHFDRLLKNLLYPALYEEKIRQLDRQHSR